MFNITSKVSVFIPFVSADAVNHVGSLTICLDTRFQATCLNGLLNTAFTSKTTEYFGTAVNQMYQLLQDRISSDSTVSGPSAQLASRFGAYIFLKLILQGL